MMKMKIRMPALSLAPGGRRSRRFTLVELLVVIVIMLIIMAIAVPAFNKMVAGSGVEAASRMVGGRLRLTRQYAITKRKRVALLMPLDDGSDADLKFRAIRACVVDTDNKFVEWIEGETWTYLPPGAVIRIVNDSTDFGDPEAFETITDVPEGGLSAGCPGLVFKPTGRMPSLQRFVHLVEGAAAGDAVIVRNPDNRVAIRVDPYTGRVSFQWPQ